MKILNNNTPAVDADELQKISEDVRLLREKDDEYARLFDRFFPKFDLEAEKRIMNKAYEDVEDDLDDNFWHATLLAHLGREVLDNAESECVKAACRGEMALVDVLNDEIERQKRIGAEIEKDPDSEVQEMRAYLRIAADIEGVEPPLEWAAKVKDSMSDDLEKAVLSKPGEQSESLEEAYIKAASRNDEGGMAAIEYVKSI